MRADEADRMGIVDHDDGFVFRGEIADRFQVGDLTRTDVAQSEARLALAQSQLRNAEARLIGSRENYIRVIGVAPGVLADPTPLPNLPDDVVVAEQVALANNPFLQAAQLSRDATRFDTRVAKAGRLPMASRVRRVVW